MSDLSLHEVAKTDLANISDFQKELHYPKPPINGKRDEGDLVRTPFYRKFEKVTWSTQLPGKMAHSENSGKSIFTADPKFDYLNGSYLFLPVPAIRVRARYRERIQICWPANLGHNIIQESYMTIDDDNSQRFDGKWLDIRTQFYCPEKRKQYLKSIGNVPELTTWATFLPEMNLYIPQPWFYSKKCRNLPLFLSKMANVKHYYTFNQKLKSLLRMRKRVGDNWEEIPCTCKFIEGAEDDKLPTPEMWGRYSLISDAEKAWRRDEPYVLYTEDVLSFSSPNAVSLGQVVEIPVSSNLPVKAFFAIVENDSASKLNNLSNYTTNKHDLIKGHTPMRQIGMTRGNIPRIPMMDIGHFDKEEPLVMFPSTPCHPGYAGFSASYDTTSSHAEIGITLDSIHQSKILIRLENTDPMLTKVKNIKLDDEDEDVLGVINPNANQANGQDNQNQNQNQNQNNGEVNQHQNQQDRPEKGLYRPHIRLLVMKKITFNYEKKVEITSAVTSAMST